MASSQKLKFTTFLLFALLATVVNTVKFLIFQFAGASMRVTTPQFPEITVFMVILATFIPLIVAGFVVWLFSDKSPKFVTFAAWAGLIFAVVTLVSPLLVAQDLATGICLASSHVVVGVIWFVAIRRSRRS